MHIGVCMCWCMYWCMCGYAYRCVYVLVYVLVYVWVCIQVCVCVGKHIGVCGMDIRGYMSYEEEDTYRCVR